MASAVVERRACPDGSVVVELRGELDINSERALKALLIDLATEGAPAIVVDMPHVTFIDSSGIGALVAGFHAAHAAGVAYRVGRVAPFVERQLRLTGLYERLVSNG